MSKALALESSDNTARPKPCKLLQTLASKSLVITVIERMGRAGKLFNYWLKKNQTKNSKKVEVKTLALQSTIYDVGLIPQSSLKALASTDIIKHENLKFQDQLLGQDCDKNEVNAGSIIIKKIPQGLPFQLLTISCTNYQAPVKQLFI